MRLKLPSMLALVFVSAAALAAPQTWYRITPIESSPGDYVQANGFNDRGEVVGWVTSDTDPIQRGFLWRDGEFTYLNDVVSPGTDYMEASSINDRSQIAGFYTDPVTRTYRGFLLDRRGVEIIDGPPGAQVVFLNLINQRSQILGASYDAEGIESGWFWDRGDITVFDQAFGYAALNDRGQVAGRYFVSGSGSHAAVWDDGEITLIGPAFSAASAINNRGQVAGSMDNDSGGRAFLWWRGQLTQLPPLLPGQSSSGAGSINQRGDVAGSTSIDLPGGTQNIATVWEDGVAIDVNARIHPGDPLRDHVRFTSARINDRGDLLAHGEDSRVAGLRFYLLERVRR